MADAFISVPIEDLRRETVIMEKPKRLNADNETIVDFTEESVEKSKDVMFIDVNESTVDIEEAKVFEQRSIEEPKHVTVNAVNETKVDIEEGKVYEQTPIDVNMLKNEVLGLGQNFSIGEGKTKPPGYVNTGYESIWNKRPIWVQFSDENPQQQQIESSRSPFIQKVFLLLFACLAVTFIFAVATFHVPGMRRFFRRKKTGLPCGITGMILLIITSIKLQCCECGRRPPCNYLGLVFTVIAECLIFGWLTATYRLREIYLALGITCLVVLLCVGLAFSPIDFTKCYIYLIIIGAVLCMFSFTVLIMTLVMKEKFPILRMVLCCCFILFHSVSIIMELQMIIGGKSLELGEDDYALGCFFLYTSVMSLFFQLLIFLGLLDSV